jgi:predicted ribosome quality control (RQC) complex YloA/Tae2 family protein
MKKFIILIDAMKCPCPPIHFTIGSNAIDNFNIIDNSYDTDLWFHIGGGRSSCHVIASIPTNIVIDRKNMKYIIKQGAVLCKSHSQYASEKNVEIHYTLIKNITKTNIVGTVKLSQYSSINI